MFFGVSVTHSKSVPPSGNAKETGLSHSNSASAVMHVRVQTRRQSENESFPHFVRNKFDYQYRAHELYIKC
jgi:hypothetical protein